ncbi:hypothetical protein N7532_004995 [Penicillium argentinense]|uniref:Uncharacterized protein n=1 Tax=Penicillium argentinense TaxID=1131581 RepID=A0A9W9K9E4_9EURO|nr:uncharacterized protein N7532_004995 [Penicillium argentinense]KAJ5097994.1 hypothetical protein N7532_004995 [Penicillium argentinense]
MSQPWLDSLSDDWPSLPASPTTPVPKQDQLDQLDSPRTVQNSPSRIPVPARRSGDQQSPASSKPSKPARRDFSKKVTRPCHFIKREPPTPKTPRTPKTPAKQRSPAPAKSKTNTPKSPRATTSTSPKRSPKSTKPSPVAAGKQPTMDTRSPLRSVSNVSSQASFQSTDTVQIKPTKGQEEGAPTPEWRKRLVQGEIAAGEQRDLFAPMGLESVFKPPTPGSATAKPGSIRFTKQEDDQLWDFTDTSRRDSATRDEEDNINAAKAANAPNANDAHGQERDRDDTEYSGTGMESPMGTVNRAPWANKCNGHGEEDPSQADDTGFRTASGLEDLRNEGISPIMFTRPNTLDGNGTSEVIKSALKQVTNKLESLSVDNSRPDSPASDSLLFYNHSEPRPEGSPHDDSLLDVTSHSLPQDLSMGTIDFSRRAGSRPFPQRFSPSPFPSQRMSPATLANIKVRSSPLFNPARKTGSPSLPRPSSSHVRPSTSGDATTKEGAMPSSGSPLKLFGEHDTFTNNRLLRRMSQFEETFEDGSDGDEPPSPSEEARRKGESRSFLNARHEPLSEISPRRNERLASRNTPRPRVNKFGDGELDKFDFSDASPYEHQLVYDASQAFGSRPTSRRQTSIRQQYLRHPSSQLGSLRYARSASSGFTRKPSAWTRQSYFDHLRDASWSSRVNRKENLGFSETKRVPKAAADPTPKRRRTILRDTAEPDHPRVNSENPQKFDDSMSLLQRSLLQHGVQIETGDYLAPPGLSTSMQRPRTPTPSQIRLSQEASKGQTRDFSESNFDELDYSDSFSLEGDIPLVKITGTSDTSRKGSITTQDYLNEATKIMDLIRAKGRPADVMTSLQESDGDSEEGNFSYEDESTREAFSRPPSREGADLRKMREPREMSPQILNHLKKYQEKEDVEFGANDMSLNLHQGNKTSAEPKMGQLAPEERKRKPSGPIDDIAADIAQDLMTINTQMSGFSINSVPTGSSQNSQAKGMLSSDLVSHLIPEQVNGFTYDRSKHQWVKGDGEPLARKIPREDGEDDPFQDIPDLSVDELQEMMRVHGLSSPTKSTEEPRTRSSSGANGSPKKVSIRPHTRDGDPSITISSVKSGASRFTASVPNSGTRDTSWGTHELPRKRNAEEASTQKDSAPASETRPRPNRVPTISFSSPLVSHVAYREDSDAPDSPADLGDSSHPEAQKDGAAHTDNVNGSVRSARQETVAGQPFIRRPISRIEERNEEGADEFSLVQRDEEMPVQRTPNAAGNSLVPMNNNGQDTSYSFHMSPLADFSVNEPDHPLNLEMSYVAHRTHPTSLRQVHGTFALATEDLIKHITDAEAYEPYWEHIRRLILPQKGLITLHKLSDFCPRLEELDVSDNDIGQLSGIPSSLRTLKIPRNCLSNLTPWSHLTNLQYLDISGNDIETLDGFSSLIHLRELKANDNQIRNIDGILDLNGLLSLKLSNNSVTTVDFEGAELTRLRDLDLSHNCLTSVHNVEWLPSLVTLDLSANQIGRFESSNAMISLRALKLSVNKLDVFDVTSFSSVSLLYLDENSLSGIAGLQHCHNLEVLSVREQAQSQSNCALDLELGSVKDVRKIFLSSNKLSPTCLSPSSPLLRLQLLDIAGCTLNALPSDFAVSYPNLKVLNLNFNSITELEPLVGMNCLARLMVVNNRLARMRRVCQVLSRLGRTGRKSPCSLRKLDIRNGTNAEKQKLKYQENAVVHHQQGHRDLSDALDDLDRNDPVDHVVTWEDGTKLNKALEVNDPFTLPAADPEADQKYLNRLDKATRLRRSVLELLLYAGTSGSLQHLDGLDLRPCLGEDSPDMERAWTKLEQLGVLRRKAITNDA